MRIARVNAFMLIEVLLILSACAKPMQTPTEPAPIPTTTAQILIAPDDYYGLGENTDAALRPPYVIVPVGTTVTWNNTDSERRECTIISHDGFFNKHLKYGESFSYTFTKRGDFRYYVEPHGLQGSVIVK